MVLSRLSRGYSAGRVVCLAVASTLLVGLLLPTLPIATLTALAQGPCTVDLNPHSAPDGATSGFAFTITDDNDSIAWVKVTSPSSHVVIVGAQSDWLPNVVQSDSFAYFFGDAIAPSNPIQVGLSASVSAFPADSWTVQASTNSDGSNPMTCGGDTSISVGDTTPPTILSLSASATITSATIQWTTDKVTNGVVAYGKTPSYGQQVIDSNYDQSHSVSLHGLSSSTTYHYQITVTDQSSNVTQSVDGTFLTATQPTSSTSGGGGGGGIVITNPRDKTPPTIRITSKLSKVFTTTPTVAGVAADNDEVARIEYSTDRGQDWLPVDHASGIGTKQASFTFHPLNLADNTYLFMARAIDGGGNIATTKVIAVVIDRLPPVLGGAVIALGPQVLIPNANGVLETLTGVGLSVHASSTGGATSIAVTAVNGAATNTTAAPASFSLQQAPDSGLWSGMLSFSTPGTYQLVAHAIDGAKNKTSRTFGTVRVAQAGRVLSANGPVKNATVTVFYRDPDTNGWTTWDGLPYGQQNPQTTDVHGGFQMFLPPGTYYVRASADGYQDLTTSSFTLTQPTPLTALLRLSPTLGIGPIHLPWINFNIQPITTARTSTTASDAATANLIGTPLAGVTLTDTSGVNQNSINWLGKPTLVTLLSTWAPAASEQVAALDKLAKNRDLNVEVIGLQENAERLRAYDAIAGISLTWLADPDSMTVNSLHAGSLPLHYFVDRKGIIRAVDYGVESYQQLLDTLSNLP